MNSTETEPILSLKGAKYDCFLLEGLKLSDFTPEAKIKTANRLFQEIFEQDEIDQERAGHFLKTATCLLETRDTPSNLKDFLSSKLGTDILEKIAVVSAQKEWSVKNAQAALDAYCAFLTIEKLWPEDAKDLYRDFSKKLIFAREADMVLEKAARKVKQEEGRGVVIYLGARGAEVAQLLSQLALRQTCEEFGAKPIIAGYYRDHILTTNFGDDSEDPDGDLMTFNETVAELCRVEGSQAGTGTNICVKIKINNKNRLSIPHGIANVGGHEVPASGQILAEMIRMIRNKGILFDGPQEADMLRQIKLQNTGVAGLISLGDGATFELDPALSQQTLYKIPAINLIQTNGIAIGAHNAEVNAQKKLSKLGLGKDVPGITVEKDNPDKMYLAVRFAAIRALKHAGPTVIEALVTRGVAHSSEHGDSDTASMIKKAYDLLSSALEKNNLSKEKIDRFLDRKGGGLFRAPESDNIILLKERVQKFCSETDLDPDTKKELESLAQNIIDPLEEALYSWKKAGFITEEEISSWKESAKEKYNKVYDRLFAKESGEVNAPFILKRPDSSNIMETVRLATPREVLLPPLSTVSALNQAEALRYAYDKFLTYSDRTILVGEDIRKGWAVNRDPKTLMYGFNYEGGYFRQQEGLWPKYGHIPFKFLNIPISEFNTAMFWAGVATTPADKKSLEESFRVIIDDQYGDYGIQGETMYHILAHVLQNTGGRVTRTLGMVLTSGANVGGGAGAMHAHEVFLKAFATPDSVDVFYTSDPLSTYTNILGSSLYNNNMWIGLVDKTRIFETSPVDPKKDLWYRPGRARVVKWGKGLQFLAYGPMVGIINEAIKNSPPNKTHDIGLLDLVYARPFPYGDLVDFLKGSKKPIIVAHQESAGRNSPDESDKLSTILNKTYNDEGEVNLSKGLGPHIIDKLRTDKYLSAITNGRLVYHFGAKPTAAPLCDKRLLAPTIPTVEDITKLILAHQ